MSSNRSTGGAKRTQSKYQHAGRGAQELEEFIAVEEGWVCVDVSG